MFGFSSTGGLFFPEISPGLAWFPRGLQNITFGISEAGFYRPDALPVAQPTNSAAL